MSFRIGTNQQLLPYRRLTVILTSLCIYNSKGLVTQGNFYRQLGGNQLHCTQREQQICPHYFTVSKKDTWKLTCECLFFLEIAWAWLPVTRLCDMALILHDKSPHFHSSAYCEHGGMSHAISK